MSTTTHSPQSAAQRSQFDDYQHDIVDANGNRLLTVLITEEYCTPDDVDAIIAKVLTAVNAHASLVSACERAEPIQIRFPNEIRDKIKALARSEKHKNQSLIVRKIVERHFNGNGP